MNPVDFKFKNPFHQQPKTDPVKAPEGYQGPTTALQRHVAFFDGRNGKPADGIVTVEETTAGLEKMGISHGWAKFAATVINGALAPDTNGKNGSTVVIPNIGAATHEGDTSIFNRNGDQVQGRLNDTFTKYDANRDGALSQSEIHAMQDQRAHTVKGALATRLEFGLLMAITDTTVETKDGTEPALTRARLQSFYDGELFYDIEKNPATQHFDAGLFASEIWGGVSAAAGQAIDGVEASAGRAVDKALHLLDKK